MPTALLYLDFDYSEDDAGHGCLDAMADVPAARAPQVEAELAQVLAWVHAQHSWRLSPLDDGGDWDYLVQATPDGSAPLVLEYDPLRAQFKKSPGFAPTTGRVVYTFTLSAREDLCTALREAFAIG
ncbi:MAG: hypothetical protein ACK40S_05250 [Burkholderiaceae bacterium]